MDYKQEYEKAYYDEKLAKILHELTSEPLLDYIRRRIEEISPEPKESEDERIIKNPADKSDVLMSLDEAIAHCKEKSCGDNACALEHKQLEKWLIELKELKRRKTAWSKEDEKYYNSAIWHINNSVHNGSSGGGSDTVNWLESLKKKYTWKPSKEQIIALRWVLNNVPYNKHKEEISGLLDQIKNL